MRSGIRRITYLCAIAMMAACTVSAADNGGAPMDYRIIETNYGPWIHFRDWTLADGEGELHPPGGTVQVLTEGTVDVVRDNYPLPGGGDVETTLTFNFERADADSSATFYFNRSREGTGFRVRFDADGVRAHHMEEPVYEGDAVSMERPVVHELTLVTLGDAWALALNGKQIAEGRLEVTDGANEGQLGVIVEDAGVRLITCEESFIAHRVDFGEWERGELLYEESFGADSVAENWVVKGEAPTVADDSVTWNAMSVNMLRERFEGPIAIDCRVTPQEDSPKER
ncbi:MAG: hypothetical protein GF393_09550, partial [Armatimonadia bacterium]|nr:hypothetical protein [Armatimonadia bacterium]